MHRDGEDGQRPRRSFSGFSGVVPTLMTTAPAREPIRDKRRKCSVMKVEQDEGLTSCTHMIWNERSGRMISWRRISTELKTGVAGSTPTSTVIERGVLA